MRDMDPRFTFCEHYARNFTRWDNKLYQIKDKFQELADKIQEVGDLGDEANTAATGYAEWKVFR